MSTIEQTATFAALPQTTRGKTVKISGDPKGKNFLYCHGQSVYIRNIGNPNDVDIYTEHAKPTTVARYSPSGFYIASGDSLGKIRIWDTVNKTHILKNEVHALGRMINDLEWSPDSTKIVAGGDGADRFSKVFTMDSGNTVGDISGHCKPVNACAFRSERPFRLVTASEDFTLAFFKGPPFEFVKTLKNHTNFVNVVRFSPKGEVFISGGSDGKLFKFDGKEGDLLGELIDPQEGKGKERAHGGGIYDLCFSPDKKQVLTASGDKKAKIFDYESDCLLKVFDLGMQGDWHYMQLGCLWQGDHILTVNGYGHITYHNFDEPSQPLRVIKGHMQPISAMTVSGDRSLIFTGSLEGSFWWEAASGANDNFIGKGHANQVTDMAVDGDTLYSVGVDDTLRFSSVSDRKFSDDAVKLDSQPKAVAVRDGVVVVACVKHVIVLEGRQRRSMMSTKDEAVSVSMRPKGSEVAVAFQNGKMCIYTIENWTLTEKQEISLEKVPSCLAYSSDGEFLAVNGERIVYTYRTSDYTVLSQGQPHAARVTCLAWAPNKARFVTGSIDSHVVLWDNVTGSIGERPKFKAHTMSYSNKVAWIDDETFVSAGQDSNVKVFKVSD